MRGWQGGGSPLRVVSGVMKFMSKNGYIHCHANHCCYFKKFDNSYVILLLYVDDMLVAGFDMEKIKNLKEQMSMEFSMKDLGAVKQILGLKIERDRKNKLLKLCQREYMRKRRSISVTMQDCT
jgi:Reverse transcriptase (RNA-dependent DNA polymerase)